jgi:hypothetical protein
MIHVMLKSLVDCVMVASRSKILLVVLYRLEDSNVT